MRRAKAYSSFFSQVIVVYLHPFRRNSLFCSEKIAKKSLKINIYRFQGRSRLSMLINPKSLSPVLVMISSMYVSICHHFYATRENCGKI